MGLQIIEQPNGLLCVFSPAIESWVLWDATEEELVEFYRDEATRKVEQAVRDAVKYVTKDNPRLYYGGSTLTFKQANDRHLANEGNEVFRPNDLVDRSVTL